MIGGQGREMKSTVLTSRPGTETAWHRSRLSASRRLWHLRWLDTGRGDNSAYDIELAFLQRSGAAAFEKYQLPCFFFLFFDIFNVFIRIKMMKTLENLPHNRLSAAFIVIWQINLIHVGIFNN